MKIIDKLERRISWFAIRNLTIYIVAGSMIVWFLDYVFINFGLNERLALNPLMVFQGEVWRLISFIFINSFGSSPLSMLLELYFIFMVGRNLEACWGSFRLTLYYFLGLIVTIIVSLITGVTVVGARYIHLSLFFAFASIAPEMRILLFFIIPVKIKWLAWVSWAFLAFEFIMSQSWGHRLIIVAPLVSYILFFWHDIINTIRRNRVASKNKLTYERRKTEARVIKASFHKCEICGLTEIDAPDMDFRYCSKCNGNYEYCMNHLSNHHHRSE